jgi:hypothetical protein
VSGPLLGPPDGGEPELPDAAPPGASSPGVAPPEPAPAAALDNSEAAAPRQLVTAVPAAAAAAPRLAVKAAPTAAPVLNKKEKLIQVQLFKNTDLSRFSPTPKNLISQKFNFQVQNLKTLLTYGIISTNDTFYYNKL